MKKALLKTLLCATAVILLSVAGCTTTSPGNPAPAAVLTPAPLPTLAMPADALPMNGSVRLGNDTHAITVSLDSFEVDPQTEPGKHTVTIYVAAKNTGTDPLMYVWFSRLTDLHGNQYGGIGLSHAGSGARTWWIAPNTSEAARDYVVVNSDQGLAALARGAVLDVYFMEQKVNTTHSLVPDYHVSWVIDPGTIR